MNSQFHPPQSEQITAIERSRTTVSRSLPPRITVHHDQCGRSYTQNGNAGAVGGPCRRLLIAWTKQLRDMRPTVFPHRFLWLFVWGKILPFERTGPLRGGDQRGKSLSTEGIQSTLPTRQRVTPRTTHALTHARAVFSIRDTADGISTLIRHTWSSPGLSSKIQRGVFD